MKRTNSRAQDVNREATLTPLDLVGLFPNDHHSMESEEKRKILVLPSSGICVSSAISIFFLLLYN